MERIALWLSAVMVALLGLACVGVSAQDEPPAGEAAQETAAPAEKAEAEPASTETPAVDENSPLKTEVDKVSYCIGADIGRNLKRQFVEINPEALRMGLADAMADKEALLLTDDQIREIMTAFGQKQQEKIQAEMKKLGEKNLAAGEAFLAENAKREGVVALPSGLQYEILTEGTGEMPKATDTVTTHYRGTLIDGTEFDSSIKRGEPATFPVSGVIPGWTEALQLMKVGSKWKLFIPAKLAYGDRQRGPIIQPNSTLVFEIELLGIEKTPE